MKIFEMTINHLRLIIWRLTLSENLIFNLLPKNNNPYHFTIIQLLFRSYRSINSVSKTTAKVPTRPLKSPEGEIPRR